MLHRKLDSPFDPLFSTRLCLLFVARYSWELGISPNHEAGRDQSTINQSIEQLNRCLAEDENGSDDRRLLAFGLISLSTALPSGYSYSSPHSHSLLRSSYIFILDLLLNPTPPCLASLSICSLLSSESRASIASKLANLLFADAIATRCR